MILLISLIFAGLFQVSQVFAAREILHHAAARGARAKTVGFNKHMVHKAILAGAIPNAGRMVTPDLDLSDPARASMMQRSSPGRLWSWALRSTPSSARYVVEAARIPEFMASPNLARARYILDYEDWDTIDRSFDEQADVIHVEAAQDYPLWVPGRRAFWPSSSVNLHGESYIESHYGFYIDDHDW